MSRSKHKNSGDVAGVTIHDIGNGKGIFFIWGGIVSFWGTGPECREYIIYSFFFSQLYCPLRFQNSLETCQWEGFLVLGNFPFTTPSPGQVSIPNSFVSLFIFCILSYHLSKKMGCLSGCLVSSARVLKLFCGICSAFKWSLMNLWGRKWSLHSIPPPS